MRRSICTLAVGILVAFHGVARADGAQDAESTQVARAESFASAAFDAYSHQEYQRAVALYLQALDAAPSSDILYNLARIYDTRIKDRQRAIEYYARYVADPGANPERLQACGERLALLREQQKIADSVSQEAPATGTSSAGPGSPSQRSASDDRHASGLTNAQIVGIVLAGAGIAGLGTGVGFGLTAKADADVAHIDCTGNACATQRGVDAAHHGTEMAMISTISFVAGGALVVGAAALLLLGGRTHAPAQDEQHVSVTPVFDRTSLSVQFRGRL